MCALKLECSGQQNGRYTERFELPDFPGSLRQRHRAFLTTLTRGRTTRTSVSLRFPHASNMPNFAIVTAHNEVWSEDLAAFMLAWQASSLGLDRLPRISIFTGDEGRENNADKPDTVDATISDVVRASASGRLISTASMLPPLQISFVRTSAYNIKPIHLLYFVNLNEPSTSCQPCQCLVCPQSQMRGF